VRFRESGVDDTLFGLELKECRRALAVGGHPVVSGCANKQVPSHCS
jgi:hypothetical protein